MSAGALPHPLIGNWITDAISAAGYPALVVLMIVENLFPPIPSEAVLPLAGYEVSRGVLTFAGVLVCATAGSVIGALILYSAGRWGGKAMIVRYAHRLHVREDDVERAEVWFSRWGAVAVFGARLVPGARSLISVPAGTLRMPLAEFVVLTTLGSALWNAVLIGAGFLLADEWHKVEDALGPLGTVVVVAVVFAAGFFAARFWRRRRSST